jgi:putative FmdB family regulatory protein
MPTYEYKCEACGHAFERFQSIKAAPVRTCPECGKRKARRLMGMGGALIFKGSGFYATDYRSSSYKDGAKKDKPPAPASDACASCPNKKKDSGACPSAAKE